MNFCFGLLYCKVKVKGVGVRDVAGRGEVGLRAAGRRTSFRCDPVFCDLIK